MFVGTQGGADVTSGGLGKHQESVTGLRQRGTRDNLSCCSFGAWQLGAANAEAGFGVGRERGVMQQVKASTFVVDPRSVVTGEVGTSGGCVRA